MDLQQRTMLYLEMVLELSAWGPVDVDALAYLHHRAAELLHEWKQVMPEAHEHLEC